MSGSSDPKAADPFAVALDAEDLKRRSVHGSLFTVASQSARMLIQLGSQLMRRPVLVGDMWTARMQLIGVDRLRPPSNSGNDLRSPYRSCP